MLQSSTPGAHGGRLLRRYNAALVELYGESYRTAIFASGTYTDTPINPYILSMQDVRCMSFPVGAG